MFSRHNKNDSIERGARHHHPGFGPGGFKFPFGMGGPQGFGPGGMRARRGDVRTAILALLAEEPMHGYQMIQEISARSDGAWSPSPGSVYPTLQQLADEDLVVSEESPSGKKIFSLTESGVAAVAESAGQPAPWEEAAQDESGMGEYRATVGKLIQAAFQIGSSGSEDQRAAAVDILTDARKKLYAILAED